MKSTSNKLAYIEGSGSIVLNTALFILKYWVGIATGSITIIADALHTLSDSLTSIVVIVGTKISSKPADGDHPFGHGRAESLASVIIGVLLFMVGLNFLWEAVQKLKHNQGAIFNVSAMVIFFISVITKEAMAQFSFWAYRKTHLHSLKADGWHHRSDAIASAIILISIFMGKNYWWIDGLFGIIVSILISYTAVEIIKEAAQPILGKKPDQDMMDKILKIAERYQFENIHHIHQHSYGSHFEFTMHICLPDDMPLHEAHSIINAFLNDIRNALKIELTIHMEPRENREIRNVEQVSEHSL